jgi:hypothetical protein
MKKSGNHKGDFLKINSKINLPKITNRFLILSVLILIMTQNSFCATFIVNNTNNSGVGSFRQAVLDANINPGLDNINFNIPGAGPHTIDLTSVVNITDAINIDGSSQPGSSMGNFLLGQGSGGGGTGFNLQIEFTRSNVVNAPMLSVNNSVFDIRGIAFKNLPHSGASENYFIDLLSSGTANIQQCFFGTNVSGNTSTLTQNDIGGIQAQGGNINISNNLFCGSTFISAYPGSSANISNNFFGTNYSGTASTFPNVPNSPACFVGTNTGVNSAVVSSNLFFNYYGKGLYFSVNGTTPNNVSLSYNYFNVNSNGSDLGLTLAGTIGMHVENSSNYTNAVQVGNNLFAGLNKAYSQNGSSAKAPILAITYPASAFGTNSLAYRHFATN